MLFKKKSNTTIITLLLVFVIILGNMCSVRAQESTDLDGKKLIDCQDEAILITSNQYSVTQTDPCITAFVQYQYYNEETGTSECKYSEETGQLFKFSVPAGTSCKIDISADLYARIFQDLSAYYCNDNSFNRDIGVTNSDSISKDYYLFVDNSDDYFVSYTISFENISLYADEDEVCFYTDIQLSLDKFYEINPSYKNKVRVVPVYNDYSGSETAFNVYDFYDYLQNSEQKSTCVFLADEFPLQTGIDSIGIDKADYPYMYAFTQNEQTNYLDFSVSPLNMIYDTEIAKEVLGSSDPASVQECISTPEKFLETAKKMKEHGYYMTSNFDYFTGYDYYEGIDEQINVLCNKLNENGYDAEYDAWYDYDWYNRGDVFSCFSVSGWMYSGYESYGKLALCVGPFNACSNWNYKLYVKNNNHNNDIAKAVIELIMNDSDIMYDLSCQLGEMLNNTEAVKKMLSDGIYPLQDYYANYLTFANNQNPLSVWDACANKTSISPNPTPDPNPAPDPKPTPDPTPVVTPAVNVSYHTHIQTLGDSQGTKTNGAMAGTSGMAKRLENIWIKVEGNKNLGIQYSTHCQSYGWLPWSANGESNGTSGEAKRLEAIKIQLTGVDKDKYDVYYRVHAQSYGWLGWAKNGEPSGTAGYGKRLEGIQIVVVKKGESAPGLDYADVKASTAVHNASAYIAKAGTSPVVGGAATSAQNPVIPGVDTTNISYRTHVQSYGWQGWKYNGQMSGTSGEAKRLEGIEIKLTNKQYSGSIVYTTHVQKYGWQGDVNDSSTWKKEGEMAGTSGEAKRLEAICIKLTGEMEKHYDVYYRVHAQSYGWLGWAKNGECAGTAGYAKRLEGIQVVLVPKGGSAPASNYGGVNANRTESYISK